MKNVSDVLIVSDSEAIRSLAKFALGKFWGVAIRNAESAEIAREAARIRHPQIAVIDASLPGADDLGRELSGKSKTIALNAEAPASWAIQSVTPPFQPPKFHAAIDALPE